jgi:RNA polymerase sigma-70 factor (ECF subfamily)
MTDRMTEQEDRALIAAIAGRQQQALERLYDRYQTLVYHLALRILNSRESAEEVVYDVFWQVWREAARYDVQRGSVGAWLAILARSRAIDALRARQGRRTVEEDLSVQLAHTSPGDDPEEITSVEQRAVLVRRALDTNPYFSLSGVKEARSTLAEIDQHVVVQGEVYGP